jgi:hypothetical protein
MRFVKIKKDLKFNNHPYGDRTWAKAGEIVFCREFNDDNNIPKPFIKLEKPNKAHYYIAAADLVYDYEILPETPLVELLYGKS